MREYYYDLALSRLLGPVILARAVCGVALLIGVGVLGYHLTAANLDPRLAGAASTVLPAVLIAWALWRPTVSGFSWWIVETLSIGTLIALAYAIIAALVRLWFAEFRIGDWLDRAWPNLLAIPCIWLVQRTIYWRVDRSAAADQMRGEPAR